MEKCEALDDYAASIRSIVFSQDFVPKVIQSLLNGFLQKTFYVQQASLPEILKIILLARTLLEVKGVQIMNLQ